jgi:hypothetical protein
MTITIRKAGEAIAKKHGGAVGATVVLRPPRHQLRINGCWWTISWTISIDIVAPTSAHQNW